MILYNFKKKKVHIQAMERYVAVITHFELRQSPRQYQYEKEAAEQSILLPLVKEKR